MINDFSRVNDGKIKNFGVNKDLELAMGRSEPGFPYIWKQMAKCRMNCGEGRKGVGLELEVLMEGVETFGIAGMDKQSEGGWKGSCEGGPGKLEAFRLPPGMSGSSWRRRLVSIQEGRVFGVKVQVKIGVIQDWVSGILKF